MNNLREINEQNNSEIWELIKGEIQMYTKGESTSVPKTVATNIIQSILFAIKQTIDNHYDGDWTRVDHNISLKIQLERGRKIIENKVKHAYRLYKLSLKTQINISNISYTDTLNELNSFFQLYDIRYGARDVPCMIDYQLLYGNADMEKKGIDYIIMYLERLVWENRFCSFFDEPDIVIVLKKYAYDYNEQLINLCDPVYNNAIGSLLIKKNKINLNLSNENQNDIQNYLMRLSSDDVNKVILESSRFLCERMGFVNNAVKYFDYVASELSVRVNCHRFSDGLNNIFMS